MKSSSMCQVCLDFDRNICISSQTMPYSLFNTKRIKFFQNQTHIPMVSNETVHQEFWSIALYYKHLEEDSNSFKTNGRTSLIEFLALLAINSNF